MNKRGRCIKGWGATEWGDESDAFAKLAEHLKRVLGREVLIPCNRVYSQNCEVCFKNDPGKIFCPKREWKYVSGEQTNEYLDLSVYGDLTDWMCSVPADLDSAGDAFSYWTGYDDGTICDCGTPFVAEFTGERWEESRRVSFRPLRKTEERLRDFDEGATYVDEATGAPRWEQHTGQHRVPEGPEDAEWNVLTRPPTVSPKACYGKPDISSIFEMSVAWKNGNIWSLDWNDGNSCILDDTYFAWYNGEPIDEESRQDEAGDHWWCEAKCNANPECGGWTLNKSNGWCALKRTDQIKKQKNKNYVSGTKNC